MAHKKIMENYRDVATEAIKAAENEGKPFRANELFKLKQIIEGLLAHPAKPEWELEVFDGVRRKIDILLKNPDACTVIDTEEPNGGIEIEIDEGLDIEEENLIIEDLI